MNNIIPFDCEGQPVRFNSDGWIDATSAAKRFGKEVHEWLRSIDTLELLLALADDPLVKAANLQPLEAESQSGPSSKTGKFPLLEKLRRMKPGSQEARSLTQEIIRSTGLVDSQRGRHGGTWLHPELGVHFALWLDKKFAIWTGRRIVELINGHEVTHNGPLEFDVQALFGQQVEQVLLGSGAGVMDACNAAEALLKAEQRVVSMCGRGMVFWKGRRKEHAQVLKRLHAEAQGVLRFDR